MTDVVTNLPAGADEGLFAEISSIQAIDQHAHPVAVGVEPAGARERPIQPQDVQVPLRMRTDNPEYLAAWSALWGIHLTDFSEKGLVDLIERKEAEISRRGNAYNTWVLEQVGIETMIGIAPGPSPSEPSPHFEWCAYAEWLLWPFAIAEVEPDGLSAVYTMVRGKMVDRFCGGDMPNTLRGYLDHIMQGALVLWREQGAVGIKFHGPYNRPLRYDEVSTETAQTVYQEGLRKGSLTPQEHKTLQDFVFERLVVEAGKAGLVVQIHTGYGVADRFDVEGSNPVLMQRIFRAAPGTKFVLLHGGWPFISQTVALLSYPNVYTDFSCATIFRSARSVSLQIREALEWWPEKLLFGTDAYSDRSLGMLAASPVKNNRLAGWEEKAWIMNQTGRAALTLALGDMRADGQVSSQVCANLSQGIMRDHARTLYDLDGRKR
ncbi:amidohydrolase family protein [uncultured Roseobacter sp.]|uniref:amidohydrolase family protein n=1 Tax=uncultured Roseobacter sp. TaxID=114847 RepID=UPI0026332A11|nr:amidohydrolase family protein [uncultured Roseobacter sp.]